MMKLKLGPLQKQKEKNYSSNKTGLKTNIFLKCSDPRDILMLFSMISKNCFNSPILWLYIDVTKLIKLLFIALKDFQLLLLQKQSYYVEIICHL